MTLGWTTDTVTTDASRALHYTLLWGLDGVVLRTLGSSGDRVPFVNEAPLRNRLDADDVPVLAVDPGLFEGEASARASWMNEVDSFGETASFCRRFGIDLVLAGALAQNPETYDEHPSAAALRQLGVEGARSGLRIAVRNDAETGVATASALVSLLQLVDHPAVVADWRPFDALQAGEDPGIGLAAFADIDRVGCLTIRDESMAGEPAIPGTGQIDWEHVLNELATRGWNGRVTLELHGRPTGTFGLHAASAIISAIRRAKRAAMP